MKKIWILTLLAVVAVGLSGCSSCGGGLFGNWFNRGDNCAPPPCSANVGPPAYSAGSPVMLAPEGGPAYLPAP
jgi:hypothetical protein